jgi:tRNA uridine 5-carboxymethylaminomethyl modification enzyme
LTELGRHVGLITEERWRAYNGKMEQLAGGREHLRSARVRSADISVQEMLGVANLRSGATFEELLRRPEIGIEDLAAIDPALAAMSSEVREQLEISVKYEGYLRRQEEDVQRFRRMEEQSIPPTLNYDQPSGLSMEVREKLKKIKPLTLGQASRIPGVTPAAVAILSVLLRRR